jgi:hypothetical protein
MVVTNKDLFKILSLDVQIKGTVVWSWSNVFTITIGQESPLTMDIAAMVVTYRVLSKIVSLDILIKEENILSQKRVFTITRGQGFPNPTDIAATVVTSKSPHKKLLTNLVLYPLLV